MASGFEADPPGPGDHAPRRDLRSRADEVLDAWCAARARGEAVPQEDLLAAHPEFRATLQARFDAMAMQASLPGALRGAPPRAQANLRAVHGDRYADFRVIGQGGMGIVYWALDTDLNRQVAFKVIRPDVGSADGGEAPPDPITMRTPPRATPASQAFETLKSRFLQEAWVTAGLEHPGIVPVYEVGQTPEGVPYYTMRFIRGSRTLARAIADVAGKDLETRLTLLEPFLKVCDTIRYAHAHGVLHRDLKPENVAIGEFGEVVVIDWGLAKMQGGADAAAETWQTRLHEFREHSDLRTIPSAMGTPGYMSPEAAMGRIQDVDARSDVYSLGAILFEIVTGRLPHEFAGYLELIMKLREHPDPDPRTCNPAVPEELARICTQSLAKDRESRTPTVDALVGALRGWITQRAADRDFEALLGRARASVDAALGLTGQLRLRQLDRAASLCDRLQTSRPAEPRVLAMLNTVAEARDAGVREQSLDVRRAAVRRTAALAFAVLVVAGAIAGYALVVGRRDAEAARADAEHERDRARRAEEATTAELWKAHVARAYAARVSLRAGRRFDAIASLTAATSIRHDPSLRDEAIAALAVADIHPLGRGDRVRIGAASTLDPDFALWADVPPADSGDTTLRRADDGSVLAVLPGPGVRGHEPRFSRDGRYLAVRHHPFEDINDVTTRVWDVARRLVVSEHRGTFASDFSPDGRTIAVGLLPSGVEVRAVEGGALVRRHETSIYGSWVSWAPDGRRIAVTSIAAGQVEIVGGAKTLSAATPPVARGSDWSPHATGLSGCSTSRPPPSRSSPNFRTRPSRRASRSLRRAPRCSRPHGTGGCVSGTFRPANSSSPSPAPSGRRSSAATGTRSASSAGRRRRGTSPTSPATPRAARSAASRRSARRSASPSTSADASRSPRESTVPPSGTSPRVAASAA